MTTTFKKLTLDWNAEPNSPMPKVAVWDHDIVLSFYMNAFVYERFGKEDIGHLRFRNCWRYRLGPTNDEGWFRGQCRFTGIAPEWGEFYEVDGDLRLEACPKDWIEVGFRDSAQKHFLFYLCDETFECDAESWTLSILR